MEICGNQKSQIDLKLCNLVDAIRSETTSISFKTRGLFYFRSLGTPEAALCVQQCLSGTSVLLDHEVAYVLGQMKQKNSVEFLISIIENKSINDIVRHEAVEALGNFEDETLIPILDRFSNDESLIVKESVYLAIKKLLEYSKHENMISRYGSRDPTFPYEGKFEEAVEMLSKGNLEDKYKAIFYFRDLNTKEAVDALAKGFDDPSDLLRHEVAYVFGQMENEHSIDALKKVLDDVNEKDIVRHEAAEALGNIGTDECVECLSKYLESDIKILRESVQVGLGISSYDEEEYLNVN